LWLKLYLSFTVRSYARCSQYRTAISDRSNFWDLTVPVALNAENNTITFFKSSTFAPGVDRRSLRRSMADAAPAVA
jgi:hypothetical protein